MTQALPPHAITAVSEAISPLAAQTLAEHGACLPDARLGNDSLLQWMPDCDALALFSNFGNSDLVSNGDRAREIAEAPLLQPVFSGFQPVIDDEERKLLWGAMLVGNMITAPSLKLQIERLIDARNHGGFSFMDPPDLNNATQNNATQNNAKRELPLRPAQKLSNETTSQIKKFAEDLGWDSKTPLHSISEMVIHTENEKQILFDYEPRVPQLWMVGSLGSLPASDSQWFSLLRLPFENGNLVGFQVVCDPFDEEIKLTCPIPTASFDASQMQQLLARFAQMLSVPLFPQEQSPAGGLRV